MAVYFQPADKYNINYYAPMLLAQAGAKLLGDEFTAMRMRAERAKNIKSEQDYYNSQLLNNTIQDPVVKDLVTQYASPQFMRMSPDAQKRAIDAFKLNAYLKTTNPLDNTYQGNIPAAITGNGQQAAGQQQANSIVGQGVAPGSGRLGAQIAWGTALGVPTAQMTAMHNVLAPQYDTKTVDANDQTYVLQTNPYVQGATQVGAYKHGISEKDKMQDATTRFGYQKQYDSNIEGHRIAAGATVAAAEKAARSNDIKERLGLANSISAMIGNFAKVANAKEGSILEDGSTVTKEMKEYASSQMKELGGAFKNILKDSGIIGQAMNPTSKPNLETTTWSQEDLNCYNRILEEIKAGKLNMTADEAKAYVISQRNKNKK